MPILLSLTFEIVTDESAARGDAESRGFEWENVPHTLREVVELINSDGFCNPSNSHGVPHWLNTEVIQDRAFFEDGEHRTLSLHPGMDARSQRYWEKACRAAGLLKDEIHWRGLIADAHYRGLRSEISYRSSDGYVLKGLAVDNASKGVGPSGRWYVCVNSWANAVPLANVVSVRQVEK